MSSTELAKRFVRDQIEIMKKHGAAPKLTPEQRRDLVTSTKRTFDGFIRTRRVAETKA